MRIDQDHNQTKHQIKSIESERIKVNEDWYEQSIIVSANDIEIWPVKKVNDLTPELIKQIIQFCPSIVLIGTGETTKFPDPALFEPFIIDSIGVEVMSTKAACRTFEALTSEGRNAVAALII